MADDSKRPEPDLIDKDKGKLVERPDRQSPTPAEAAVTDADEALTGEPRPSQRSEVR